MPLDGARVLIVEDDAALRGLLERVLVAEGCAVRTASEGPEALRLVREEPPHLIVLDLMLPWINGIEVLATVRQQPTLSEVPVLVTTGTATTAFDLRSFGRVRVLHKPVAVDAFITAVRTMLRGGDS
jgi:DNA-binding response OmpR family regulator